MGIEVRDNQIIVNTSHEQLVDTGVLNNPTETEILDMTLRSIYLRKKTSRRPHKSAGDGNPLLYALKGLGGITISYNELKKLLPSFNSLVRNICKQQDVNLIIPMPSSSKLSKIVAKRFQKELGCEILTDLFYKPTVEEACDTANFKMIPKEHYSALRAQIKSLKSTEEPQEQFSMKKVKAKVRPAFSPLSISNNIQIPDSASSILLVDDLVSSGTTLHTAKSLIDNEFDHAEIITSASLFSPVSKPRIELYA